MHIKILVAGDEVIVRRPLVKQFLEWGIEVIEFDNSPDTATFKAIFPHLVFLEKIYFKDYLDFYHQLDNTNKPGIVLIVKPDETLPPIEDVGHISILKMPYTPLSLYNTVKQALNTNATESSLEIALTQLEMICTLLTKELKPPAQDMNLTTLENNQNILPPYKKCGIIPKLKYQILSLLKDVKNNGELRRYEEQLHLLNQYILELESEQLSHIDDANIDPLLLSDLLKTHSLSRKEVKIFSMITKDMTTDEIAVKLFISPETVKSHRRNIRKKLSLVGNKVSLGDFIHHLNDNNDDNYAENRTQEYPDSVADS